MKNLDSVITRYFSAEIMLWLVCWARCSPEVPAFLQSLYIWKNWERIGESGLRPWCRTSWDAFGPWAIFAFFLLKRKSPVNLAINECLKMKQVKVGKEMVRQWKFWALLSSSSNKYGNISCGKGWWRCRSWTNWGLALWVQSCAPSTHTPVFAPGRAGLPVLLYLPDC